MSKCGEMALDIHPLFADNNLQHLLKAVKEESSSIEAARDVWSIG
jgi:hypothetical protein